MLDGMQVAVVDPPLDVAKIVTRRGRASLSRARDGGRGAGNEAAGAKGMPAALAGSVRVEITTRAAAGDAGVQRRPVAREQVGDGERAGATAGKVRRGG